MLGDEWLAVACGESQLSGRLSPGPQDFEQLTAKRLGQGSPNVTIFHKLALILAFVYSFFQGRDLDQPVLSSPLGPEPFQVPLRLSRPLQDHAKHGIEPQRLKPVVGPFNPVEFGGSSRLGEPSPQNLKRLDRHGHVLASARGK